MIEIKVYKELADDAMLVRKKVFVQEQGFVDEFDDTDGVATHLVAYDGDDPVGTCRIFIGDEPGVYILGRLAVTKEYRRHHLGARLVAAAEELARQNSGKYVMLHSQEQAVPFYEKQGYTVCSEMEYEEFCPHYWMKKQL